MKNKFSIILLLVLLTTVLAAYADSGTTSSVKVLTPSIIYTDLPQYGQYMLIPIHGLNFTENGTINISITNHTNYVVFSTVIIALPNGSFILSWNSSNNPYGKYLITAVDLNSSVIAVWSFNITSSYTFSGRIINSSNGVTLSNVYLYDENRTLLAVDDEVYTFTLDYNAEYDIIIIPINVEGLKQIIIHVIENQGPLGDIMGIDDTPESNSDFRDFEILFGLYPIITEYQYMILTLDHPAGKTGIFKCAGWNFTERRCIDDLSWVGIANTTGTETNITLYKGDPGIGIEGVPGGGGAGGGSRRGGGGRYSPCIPLWNCTAWKGCINGTIMVRNCTDLRRCEDLRYKPIEQSPCNITLLTNATINETEIEEEPKEKNINIPGIPLPEEEKPRRMAILAYFLALLVLLWVILSDRKVLIAEKSRDEEYKETTVTVKNVTKIIRQKATNILVIDEVKGEASDFRLGGAEGAKIKDLSKGITLHKFIHSLLHEEVPVMARTGDHIITALIEKGKLITLGPGESVKIVYSSEKFGKNADVKYTLGEAPKNADKEKELLKELVRYAGDARLEDHHDAVEKLEPIKQKLKKPKEEHEISLKNKVDLVERVLGHIIARKLKKTRQQRIQAELDRYMNRKIKK